MTLSTQVVNELESYQGILVGIGIGSLGLFIISLLLLPWLIRRIPADYFKRPEPEGWALLVRPQTMLRNLIGVLIIIAGFIMLVLPGQGILTILIGIAIMQFPGKRAVERWLIMRPGVLKAMNWIRTQANIQPLQF
ncbi:PGPGW domain-containing protein [Thiofilum flexile]|uniref:PGPGW domain-containing protein n=1 Tax=Thiofilum flexile TaxID=125627 RepID=UPI0003707944|nr:PGPGW domain-containing protein [Thiofilum flexile]